MQDTICAIATSPGLGAISIIRVSGPDAINIVDKLYKNGNLTESLSHSIHYGHLYDDNAVLDEVLIMLMRDPKTYTTEDTVEINCHGGISTTQKIMEVLLKNGCRLAEPGEFTKRAYLNGRISLLEAESVNDLIVSKTDASRVLAINNIDGILTRKIRNLREKLVKILANIEVNIDYPEYEDEVIVTHDLLKDYLDDIKKELDSLVKNAHNGRIINNGINVALVGKPNVGKSSILNHLLDEEKAIVTNIPGTTRDIVEGHMTLEGVEINLIDTAGIRKTSDIVEQIGVNKSKDIASKADLIIYILSNDESISEEELKLLNSLPKEKVIVLINKDDTTRNINLELIKDYKYIFGNTILDDGQDNLKKAIVDKFSLKEIVNKDMSYLTNLRQIDLIEKSSSAIKHAQDSFNEGAPVDIIEIDIKEAWEYLGSIIGESYNDELVDNIFSNFCLGK